MNNIETYPLIASCLVALFYCLVGVFLFTIYAERFKKTWRKSALLRFLFSSWFVTVSFCFVDLLISTLGFSSVYLWYENVLAIIFTTIVFFTPYLMYTEYQNSLKGN